MIPPAWDDSPGTLALRDAMAGVARVLSRDWSTGERTRAELTAEVRAPSRGGVADRIIRAVGGGQVSRTFVVRLMACMGVAGLVSEVLPLQRSYWVPLTVAIVLKPDYGAAVRARPGTTGCSPRSSPRWWWCWSTCSSPSAGAWPETGWSTR